MYTKLLKELISGEESCYKVLIYYLMSCKYGDHAHIADNKDYYSGSVVKRFIL